MHEGDTASILRAAGRKLTPQRLVIASAVRDAAGHVTATQVLHAVQRDLPYLDVSTVYRTLAMLAEQRLVTQTDIGVGEVVYEWAGAEAHHHLICGRCGGIRQLDAGVLAGLDRTLRAQYGFRPYFDHFAIFGLCGGCARKDAQS